MNGIIWLVIQLHSWLIGLYPVSFREEYGAELTAVFAEAMADAARASRRDPLIVLLREFRDYPFSLLREHWLNLTDSKVDMMSPIKKPGWGLYPIWIMLTALCIPVSAIVSLIILRIAIDIIGGYIYVDGVRHITEDYLLMYVLVPVLGLVTGVIQYGLLRRYLPRMAWWVLATFGGWLFAMLLMYFARSLNILATEALDLDTAYLALGLSIGVGQWLLLRRRLPSAGWWIAANLAGWVLLSLLTGDILDQFDPLALGFLPASVTAVTLAFLMNQDRPTEPRGV